ncbi:hypothetical protein T484DRAFT_1745820 [Baffinella frigidus]|nr:hypothetical protein T484DRAFT_1745820 [Cryptophyta sp. CCMP2293]
MLRRSDVQTRLSCVVAVLLCALSAAQALPSPGPQHLAARAPASKPAGVSDLRGGGVLDPPHRRGWSPPLVMTIGLSSILWGYDQGVVTGALLTIVPAYKLETRPDLQGMVAAAGTFGTMIGSSLAHRGAVNHADASRAWALDFGDGHRDLRCRGTSPEPRHCLLNPLTRTRHSSAPPEPRVRAVPSAMYAAECAPASSRGKILTVPQMCGCIGFTLAYIRSIYACFVG